MQQRVIVRDVSDRTETLRFPRNLDREAILARLVEVRESPQLLGHPELRAFLDGVENLPPARIAAQVIGAMDWLEGRTGLDAVAKKLSIVAMNLKNLRQLP